MRLVLPVSSRNIAGLLPPADDDSGDGSGGSDKGGFKPQAIVDGFGAFLRLVGIGSGNDVDDKPPSTPIRLEKLESMSSSLGFDQSTKGARSGRSWKTVASAITESAGSVIDAVVSRAGNDADDSEESGGGGGRDLPRLPPASRASASKGTTNFFGIGGAKASVPRYNTVFDCAYCM